QGEMRCGCCRLGYEALTGLRTRASAVRTTAVTTAAVPFLLRPSLWASLDTSVLPCCLARRAAQSLRAAALGTAPLPPPRLPDWLSLWRSPGSPTMNALPSQRSYRRCRFSPRLRDRPRCRPRSPLSHSVALDTLAPLGGPLPAQAISAYRP